MNNLVFLNKILQDKVDGKLSNAKQRAKNRYKYRLEERINRSRAIIEKELNRHNSDTKNEINDYKINENVINLKSKDSQQISYMKNEKKIKVNVNHILKKLFMLNNNRPLIDFLNSIYCDNLSLDTKIKYIINQNINNCDNEKFLSDNDLDHIEFLAYDQNKKIKYQIQFETKNNDQISINIFKEDLELNNGQSVEDNLKECKEQNNYKTKITLSKAYKILIDSNVEFPDIYKLKLESNNQCTVYKFNILKSWKYDLKKMYEKDMYLLLPLKIFDLRKRLLSIKYQIDILPKEKGGISQQETKLRNLIKDDVFKFFKSLNIYLQKIEQKGLINNDDIDEINTISINLLSSFSNEVENIVLDMKEEIQYKLKELYL